MHRRRREGACQLARAVRRGDIGVGKTAGDETMNINRIGLAALLWLLMQSAVLAGETGTALKADAMRKEPYGDAKTVATLAVGDKVDILKKSGGWLQVKSAKGKGWVRMLSVRRGDAKKGSGDAAGLLGLASGRAGTGKVVATTGIRGLSEEEL